MYPFSVFARKKQCVYCNSYMQQNLCVQCSLNFEFSTYVRKCSFILFNINKVTQHGQRTSELSSINPNFMTTIPSNSSSLHLETHVPCKICSWIFSSLNTGGILRFPNTSSKHNGPIIPSLRRNTYCITLILPNWNISNLMVPLPTETPKIHQHITNLSPTFTLSGTFHNNESYWRDLRSQVHQCSSNNLTTN